jgi:uncharacterized protein
MPEEIRMTAPADIPIPYRIVALIQERNRLFAYPPDRVATDIWSTKFRCNCCGACCTRVINGHIFLLEHDVARAEKIDPAAIEPAPDPEFCDQHGTLYVSGYALRTKDDAPGSCWFLKNGKCQIYDRRFSACRIYPHMLRRSTDMRGNVSWLKFAKKNEHGISDSALSLEECVGVAREVKEYENAFLTQQIVFLETIHEYFSIRNLQHDPVIFKDCIQQYRQGRPVDIKVFHAGELEEYRNTRPEICR